MVKIIHNKIKCKVCGDIIESNYTHDFKWCKCGSVAVDGGHEYLKRCGKLDQYEELSETESIDKKKLCDEGYENVIVFENPSFDGALIGVTTDNRAVYSYSKMIKCAMEQENWTEEEAIDWIDYNTIRSLPYTEGSPIIMYEI